MVLPVTRHPAANHEQGSAAAHAIVPLSTFSTSPLAADIRITPAELSNSVQPGTENVRFVTPTATGRLGAKPEAPDVSAGLPLSADSGRLPGYLDIFFPTREKSRKLAPAWIQKIGA